MNIHEHQAKEILKEFGIGVPNGLVIFNVDDLKNKVKKFKTSNLIVKAQIHAGGRGKAGGIKIVNNENELIKEASSMLGKILVTPQTGSSGRKVKRLYIEETCDIAKEFYLSCLVDRSSSKIAFISSAEGGVDIEEVAKRNPKKIITVKLGLSKSVNKNDINKILEPFTLTEKSKKKLLKLFNRFIKF